MKARRLLGVTFRLDLREYFHERAVRSYEKRSPLNPHNFFAVHILFLEDAKLFANCFVYISKEGIGQVIFFLELLLRFGSVAGIPRTTAPAA